MRRMKRIVLASASPRRRELLEKLGLKFEVAPSNCPEDNNIGDPHELVKAIALQKASSVAARYRGVIVIGADTIGVLDGRILGKPRGAEEAKRMLESLGGKRHAVITGLAIIDTGTGKTLTHSVETSVYFRKLAAAEIEAYVRSGEPLDKAGAYAIQGLGAVLVERIEGDYYNVIGLPLSALAECLKQFGIDVFSAREEKK